MKSNKRIQSAPAAQDHNPRDIIDNVIWAPAVHILTKAIEAICLVRMKSVCF